MAKRLRDQRQGKVETTGQDEDNGWQDDTSLASATKSWTNSWILEVMCENLYPPSATRSDTNLKRWYKRDAR